MDIWAQNGINHVPCDIKLKRLKLILFEIGGACPEVGASPVVALLSKKENNQNKN